MTLFLTWSIVLLALFLIPMTRMEENEKPETLDQIVEELNKPDDLLDKRHETFSGQAVLRVEFVRYLNTDMKRSNGHFCDPYASGTTPESACDPLFSAELVLDGGKSLKLLLPTNHYSNVIQELVFEKKVGFTDNPIEKTILVKNQNGDMFLEIKIEDYDPDKSYNDLIEIFIEKLDRNVRKYKEIQMVNPGSAHRLTVKYYFQCSDNFYGPSCTTRCVPQDNDTNGHYQCSPEGEKICRKGWMNADLDCITPDWCKWC